MGLVFCFVFAEPSCIYFFFLLDFFFFTKRVHTRNKRNSQKSVIGQKKSGKDECPSIHNLFKRGTNRSGKKKKKFWCGVTRKEPKEGTLVIKPAQDEAKKKREDGMGWVLLTSKSSVELMIEVN